MAVAPDDEEAEGYSSGPQSLLEDAGFSPDQAAALVEAMRMCVEEEEGSAAPAGPAPKKGGIDLALVFPSKKKGGK